jgi:hypothetical protein
VCVMASPDIGYFCPTHRKGQIGHRQAEVGLVPITSGKGLDENER